MRVQAVGKDEIPSSKRSGKWIETFEQIKKELQNSEAVKLNFDTETESTNARNSLYFYAHGAGYKLRRRGTNLFVVKE